MSFIFILSLFIGSIHAKAADTPWGVPWPPSSAVDVSEVFEVPNLGTSTNAAYVNDDAKNSVTLTPGEESKFGVMWSKEQIDLKKDFSYESYVYLGIDNPPSYGPADGLALVFQNDAKGTKAYGHTGYGLGVYPNLNISSEEDYFVKNSFVIEMDTYYNGVRNDTSTTEINIPITSNGHVAGVITNDSIANYWGSAQYHLNPIVGTSTSPVSNSKWTVLNVRWDANTQTFYWRYGDYSEQSYHIENLNHVFGGTKVRFGFTASTGAGYENHLVSISALPFPKISLSKTTNKDIAEIGDTVSYTVTATNEGGVETEDTLFTDVFPKGMSKPKNIALLGSTGTRYPLQEGATSANSTGEYYEWDDSTRTLKVYSNPIDKLGENQTIGTKKILVYDSQVVTGYDGELKKNVVTLSASNISQHPTADATVTIKAPKLEIDKSVDQQTVSIGDEINYTVKASNTGSVALKNPYIVDTLPEGLEKPSNIRINLENNTSSALSESQANANTDGQYYLWNNDTRQLTVYLSSTKNLKSGYTASVYYDSKLLAGTDKEVKTNTAQLFGDNDNGNNPKDSASITVSGKPKLGIVKEASPTKVKVGEVVNYTVTLSNTGDVYAEKPIIKDILPEGMEKPSNIVLQGGLSVPLEEGSTNANEWGEYYEWDEGTRTLTVYISQTDNQAPNSNRVLTYSSKVVQGTAGELKTNIATGSAANTTDKPSDKATVTVDRTMIWFHVKQEIVNRQNSVVLPTTGSLNLKNVDVANISNQMSESSMIIPSYEADTNQAFKTVAFIWNEEYKGYLPEAKIPELYTYIGYQLTAVEQTHQSVNRVNKPIPVIDYSSNSEYWLTVYIEPKTSEDGPPFYNWDYKINDFGTIKLN